MLYLSEIKVLLLLLNKWHSTSLHVSFHKESSSGSSCNTFRTHRFFIFFSVHVLQNSGKLIMF